MEKSLGMKPKRYIVKLFLLFAFLIITVFLALLVGSESIGAAKLAGIIFGAEDNSFLHSIIFDIRLPRVILALAVGGGLSIAGAVFQATLMNPLAEPYILGISSGGAFGAVLSFMLGLSFFSTQLFAFAGTLSVVFIVFFLGRRFGELEPNTLLLSGVMVGAFLSAVILVMITLLNESLRSAIFWLMGNLSGANGSNVYYIFAVSIAISIFLSVNSNKYNLLSLGTESASTLGLETNRLKNVTYISASILTGAVVSVSGIIGFIGLIVPHFCRMIFGLDNRIVVPASFFVGAIFLIIADAVARTIISPAELPVGAITAILGAPVFIYLLRKRFNA
ncbi:MAG: iron ABC transporter permease [Chlorobi bacterium]|nr:iron ABC transporter permease [Chlorobiota bacterium]